MAIFLVQHGKALSEEIDPKRGLSEAGKTEVVQIAKVAQNYQVKVSSIIHSGKKRAKQTADIFNEYLKPENGVHEKSGLNPLDDVPEFAASLMNNDTMYVGHLPFMDKLTSFLITASTNKPVFKFQNGGIVCLEYNPETDIWIIKWTLMPNIN